MTYPHKLDLNDDEIFAFNKWKKFIENEKSGGGGDDDDEEDDTVRMKEKLNLEAVDYRFKGEFMQPF